MESACNTPTLITPGIFSTCILTRTGGGGLGIRGQPPEAIPKHLHLPHRGAVRPQPLLRGDGCLRLRLVTRGTDGVSELLANSHVFVLVCVPGFLPSRIRCVKDCPLADGVPLGVSWERVVKRSFHLRLRGQKFQQLARHGRRRAYEHHQLLFVRQLVLKLACQLGIGQARDPRLAVSQELQRAARIFLGCVLQ
eukprot:16439134-Heterocapsa_arctica.AAC.1